MLEPRGVLPAAVIFTDRVALLAAFYGGVAGLPVLHADADHVVLGDHCVQLTVHAIPGANSGGDTQAYPIREDSAIKLCLPVPDLALARIAAGRLGGALWPVEREWTARGFRACDGRDPDGNVFQLRQPWPT